MRGKKNRRGVPSEGNEGDVARASDAAEEALFKALENFAFPLRPPPPSFLPSARPIKRWRFVSHLSPLASNTGVRVRGGGGESAEDKLSPPIGSSNCLKREATNEDRPAVIYGRPPRRSSIIMISLCPSREHATALHSRQHQRVRGVCA